jgi:hypothetical protein
MILLFDLLRRKTTMKLFSKLSQICVALLVVAAIAIPSFAQNPATYGTAGGRYGLTGWAINNQRVASQYNYYIDSVISQGAALGLFQFPAMTCQQALPFGGKNVNPFNTNATVKVVDIVSANTETVALSSITLSQAVCSLSLATSNPHATDSYILRSGTCGLKEAQNDKGANAGTIIVDQKFYDDGCNAATITSLVGGVTNDYIVDISNGQYNTYGWNGTAFRLVTQASNNHVGYGNPDIIGTGTSPVTVTFSKAYTAAPVCIAADQSATPAAVQVAPTTTQVVLTGTAVHTIAYVCVGNPN